MKILPTSWRNMEKEEEFSECVSFGCLNISFDECDFAFAPENCSWLAMKKMEKGLSDDKKDIQ